MRSLIRRIDRRITAAWHYCANVHYYLARGHRIRQAISMARDTL